MSSMVKKQGKKYISIKLDAEIVKRLEALKHPGQSFNGVVLELLERKK